MIISNTPESTAKAAQVIAAGGLIAFRTDTLYGLGANPLNREAVQKIRSLKGREENKPILLLISDLDQMTRFISRQSASFKKLAAKLWPGPLTIIGLAHSTLPEELTAGAGTIGLRLPADEDVRVLVKTCGGALTATSANPSASPPARNAQEVAGYFSVGLDLIIDAGEVTNESPSTVVDATGKLPKLVREGVITRGELERLGFALATPEE